MVKKQQRRTRRIFTPEFRAEAVRLCKVGDRNISQVAKDLDLTENSLREWVRRADVDAVQGPPDALTTAQREELMRLRARISDSRSMDSGELHIATR
jgi:transposase